MGMDSKVIEELATTTVRESILLCDFLRPYITENDKEPFWDGHIYIYNDKSCTKEKFKGRLPAQVKGKEMKSLAKKEISYSVSITDMRGYLADGGVIYFVVGIAPNGIERKIYYCELPPIKLRTKLANVGKQKTKNLKLKEFPIQKEEQTRIVLNCFRNSQKQSSFADAKLPTIEELEQMNVLEGFSIPFTKMGSEDPRDALLNSEVYLYAQIKGSAILQPIEVIPTNLHSNTVIKTPITINGKVYYDQLIQIKTAEETKLIIGDSLKIITRKGDIRFNIKYKGSSKARSYAKDLEFMLNYIENGCFQIGDTRVDFDRSTADFSNFDIDREKEYLVQIKEIVQVLDILNCKEDFDFTVLTNEQGRNLRRLIDAFIYGKKISGLMSDLPPVAKIDIGELQFAICLQKVDESDEYIISDFFSTEMEEVFAVIGDKKILTSQYSFLRKEELLVLNNIRFDVLLPSFKKLPRTNDVVEHANLFMLELLSAFDETRKPEFLTTAEEFCTWLLDSKEDELPFEIKELNRLQIKRRSGSLTNDDEDILYKLIEESQETTTKLAAYLLLDQMSAARYHFDKLDKETQQMFRTYPIFVYWKE